MTKRERELLRRLVESYYFISGIRHDAIVRKDGHYISQTEGIDLAIEKLVETYPEARYYLVRAKKKAKSSVKQEKTSEAKGQKRREAAKEAAKKDA